MTDATLIVDCDKEPIHIPGAIQPHGALLVVDEAGVITTVSGNVAEALESELGPSDILGKSLALLLSETSVQALLQVFSGPLQQRLLPIGVNLKHGSQRLALVHRNSQGHIIVEFERESARAAHAQVLGTIQQLLESFYAVEGTLSLCEVAAREVRSLTKFDRVMVYRFASDFSGQVVAEDVVNELQPFMGWRYPATDIPAQARRLYRKNWVRLIVDAAYEPAPLLALSDEEPLDLSYASLRSVSPVHCKYMLNMGSHASMSISLLDAQGELWGLIACHHREPLHISHPVRTACEMLGQVLSWQLQARQRAEAMAEAAERQMRLTRLVDAIATEETRPTALANALEIVSELVHCTTCVVLEGTRIRWVGPEVDSRVLFAIRDVIEAEADGGVFATDRSSKFDEDLRAHSDAVAGVIGLQLGQPPTNAWIIWLRPQQVRTIDWGGNPHAAKLVDTAPDGERYLSPRQSFKLWQETVEDQAEAWSDSEIQIVQELCRLLNEHAGRQADRLRALTEQLTAANRSKDEFLAVVSHELRTPLNAINGWVKMLRSGRLSEAQAANAIEVIERNASVQTQIIDDLLDISRIVSGRLRLDLSILDPVSSIEAAIDTIKPTADAADVAITAALEPDAGPIYGDGDRLHQVAWNLISNAVKYTQKGGRIRIMLRRVASMMELVVNDNGAGFHPDDRYRMFESFEQLPGADGKKRRGLGLGLSIVKMLAELHGGSVDASSPGRGKGATFVVRLPLAATQTLKADPIRTAADEASDLDVPDLSGRRLLVVEDEADSRSMVVTLLEGSHAEVVAFESAEEALHHLEQVDDGFDCIISDIGLPGLDGYAFLEMVRASDRPYASYPAVALTAYARPKDRTRAYRAGFQSHVAKPVDPAELLAVVESLI